MAPVAAAQDLGEPGAMSGGKIYKDLQPAMLSLSRAADGKPGDFIIRLTSRYGQSGCQHIGKVGYQMDFQDMYLDISALQYSVDTTNLPLHPEYQCSGAQVYPAAEIPLNVDELKKRGTTQIRFQDTGENDYYDIIYGDHYIEITPQLPEASPNPRYQPATDFGNVKNPLKVWFYPAGTVILRTGDVSRNTVIRGQMDALARRHQMVPLDTVLKGFTSPIKDPDSFYYVDKSKGRLLMKKPGIKDGIPFDVITMSATVYGATGNESVARQIQVFAHTPGAYE